MNQGLRQSAAVRLVERQFPERVPQDRVVVHRQAAESNGCQRHERQTARRDVDGQGGRQEDGRVGHCGNKGGRPPAASAVDGCPVADCLRRVASVIDAPPSRRRPAGRSIQQFGSLSEYERSVQHGDSRK